jgi:hypothetical protein
MNLLEAILNAQGGAAAQQAGQSVGLSPQQTSSALSALVPALAAGLHRNASQPGGLESLLGALGSGGHGRYLENPSVLGAGETVADGNKILGHILGSKDVSRALAGRASAQTGIGADVLKKLLPLAATMVMASLAKQGAGQRSAAGMTPGMGWAGGGGLMDMLTPMLDQNRDGSALDDIFSRVGRMFGG